MTTAAVVAAATVPSVGATLHVERPLTERVLDRLPGSRVGWLLLWGLSPFMAYELANVVWGLPNYLGLPANLAFGLANLVALWAAGRLAARIERLQPTLERLLAPEDLAPRRHPFRHVGRLRGPLLLSALSVLSWELVDFVGSPSVATAFVMAAVFVGQLGISTFLWIYGVSLFGLDRIGRRTLHLEPFTTEPTLGLKPLGSLAFESFLLLAAAGTPPIAFVLGDVRGVVVGLGTVAIFAALFILSAYSLHRTLVAAKASHLQWAHGLVVAALASIEQHGREPADEAAIVAVLGEARPALAAATEIERRALAIQEWPFDATIVRAVAAILTSVTAVVIARLLLSRLGM